MAGIFGLGDVDPDLYSRGQGGVNCLIAAIFAACVGNYGWEAASEGNLMGVPVTIVSGSVTIWMTYCAYLIFSGHR